MNSYAMRSQRAARGLARAYPKLPFKRYVLKIVARLEGGEMFSTTLREILDRHHGVLVGNYSYGSLLELGMADRGTTIGSYVSTGPNVRRIGAAHPLSHRMLHPFWYNASLGYVGQDADVERTTCTIGHDVWIGANATILPSCKVIGDGAVIGAGAIVTKDVAPYSIVAGVPAREISTRLDECDRLAMRNISNWDAPPAMLERQFSQMPMNCADAG